MFTDILPLHFPVMHQDLLPSWLPPSISLMDPGCAQRPQGATSRYFRPTGLVYEDQLARTYLEDMLQFGSQFRHASDAAYFQAGGMDDFFSGSMQEIKSAILAQGRDDVHKAQEQAAQAQLLLLLGFHLEEKMIELGVLQERITSFAGAFADNLGMNNDKPCSLTQHLHGDQGGGLTPDMDWRRLVSPFLEFIPRKTCLVVSEPQILEDLKEQGLEPASARDQLPALFPDWEPPESLLCSINPMTAGQLGRYAGVKVPEDLHDKEIFLLGLSRH